ncbi:hypothetical protein [Frigoriglobus tundricola]|uniref:Uncharacterized protein n=1 Tax=Frigoriglobus tundricola TaxID=2774151 RepID=A0A6M5YH13_9BACT|nr:hypothetical protein [Frigoriglobus tundricola]QJW92533.1 hypothetical protein FTUN_0029 [Frigoriglobus tundricola]
MAAKTLRLLAEVSISGRHVGRLTETIGAELAARRDEHAEAHRRRQLDAQVPNVPSVVAVEVDGGRYQRRAEGQGCGARDPHWREDKVACLVTLEGPTCETDPQPEPPECFLDRKHVGNMTQCSATCEPTIGSASAESKAVAQPDAHAWQPERLVHVRGDDARQRSVRSIGGCGSAARGNFGAASRRAFVGDGQAYNWAIQTRWFAEYVPVVDFIHVLSYARQAARATGGSDAEQWDRYALDAGVLAGSGVRGTRGDGS